jgi:glycosyltransferase involved in cell wall biosynthesis
VHIHSNGLLAEMAALVAQWMRRPFVLTLYGTEIWHYRPRWFGFDPFTRAYHRADHVTFYSQLLADRANELGLSRNNTSVVYPPVPEAFSPSDLEERRRVRAALGLRRRHILLNVKRLHPLAGQSYAIEALAAVVKTHPDTQLVFCGTGPLQRDLETLASRLGVERHVTFAGLVENALIARYCAAADVFVLPSLLEACPTVAVEALACGTPVVSSDNPGGIELRALFGDDVSVVPMKQSEALADAISAVLSRRHRVRATATEIIDREFRPRAVSARFREIYGRLLDPAS